MFARQSLIRKAIARTEQELLTKEMRIFHPFGLTPQLYGTIAEVQARLVKLDQVRQRNRPVVRRPPRGIVVQVSD